MPVEAMDECLDRGLVQVAQVAGCLPRLLAQHHGLRADEAEGIDHDLIMKRKGQEHQQIQ